MIRSESGAMVGLVAPQRRCDAVVARGLAVVGRPGSGSSTEHGAFADAGQPAWHRGNYRRFDCGGGGRDCAYGWCAHSPVRMNGRH